MNYIKPPSSATPFPSGLSDKIEEVINSFSNISGIPVTFFDNNGEIKWECLSSQKMCTFFTQYQEQNSICKKKLVTSANLASKLGEPYVFFCPAGFVKMAFSLIIDSKIVGFFMAGPIIMGKIDENIITNMFNLNNIPRESYSKIIIFIRNMKIYTPKDVSYLSTLLNSCVLSCILKNEDYVKINSQYKEQSRIGEDLQNYKKQKSLMLYPYNTEKELIQKLKSGDSKSAQETMQVLLNEILLIEAGNLNLVKTRILELCTILSRATVSDATSFQKNYEINFHDINLLNKVESIDELRLWTSKLIDHFSENVFDNLYSGNSHIIRQAVQYINANYMHKISLNNIANSLHVNQSYLSMLFKQEMDINFTDYLNEIRVKRSRDLLKTTNLSLIEISLYTGFEDQSYFTKVFKKFEGYTPSQYRKKISKV